MRSKVLIVDDDASVRTVLGEFLKSHQSDVELLFAENGAEALKVLEAQSADLVITDLMMPVMDGFTLLANIANRFPSVPRIVMSSSESAAMRLHQELSGFEAFLVKPLNSKVLESKVLRALQARNETGFLRGISLVSFVQLIDLEQKTCTVRVTRQGNPLEASLFFNHGQMLNAQLGEQTGIEAAYEILGWKNPQISILNECPGISDSIRMPVHAILLEAAFRVDSAASSELPPNEPTLADIPKITAKPAPSLAEFQASLASSESEVVEAKSDQSGTSNPAPLSTAPVVPQPPAKKTAKSLREILASQTVEFDTRLSAAPPGPGPADASKREPAGEVPIPQPEPPSGRTKSLRDETIEFDTSRLGRFLVDRPALRGASGASSANPESVNLEANNRKGSFARRNVQEEGDDFNEFMEQGIEAFKSGEFQAAVTFWERAKELRPHDARVQYNLKLASKKLSKG